MIEVEIWSDFVCPFCCIGKRNFEKALAQFAGRDQVQVIFKSFELDPLAPKSQKQSIYAVLAKKYGRTEDWARQMNINVVKMAAEAGVHFVMDKVIPTNSFDAHRLSFLAAKKYLQAAWQDRMFAAYFSEGLDIADLSVLEKLATEIGLQVEEIRQVLHSNTYSVDVRSDEEQAAEFGIEGVPYFIFNREFALSGAQPVEVFQEALSKMTDSSLVK